MEKLKLINQFASSLSAEQIKNLPEEQILNMAMERPEHPGTFGFMLSLQYFKTKENMAEIMSALMKRLGEVKNLKDKMNELK